MTEATLASRILLLGLAWLLITAAALAYQMGLFRPRVERLPPTNPKMRAEQYQELLACHPRSGPGRAGWPS